MYTSVVKYIDDIIDFFEKYSGYTEKELESADIFSLIVEHLKYGTITILSDEYGVYALSRWNIDGDTAEVLDLIISRNGGADLVNEMIQIGARPFPDVKYITFNRQRKYGDTTKTKLYKIKGR